MMNQDEQAKKFSQVIAKCWADDGYKKKLMADPVAVLKADGIELPAGMEVRPVENTESLLHIVVPAKPTELSDEDLDKVAGGAIVTKITFTPPSVNSYVCLLPPPTLCN